MSRLADRHSGTLDGQLSPIGTRQASVALIIEPGAASLTAVQHTAWMLTNLLVRLEGIVSKIAISGEDADLHERVAPLASDAPTLHTALLDLAESVNAVPARARKPDHTDIQFHIGPGESVDGWRVHGEGYCGAISQHTINSVTTSTLPIGPYIAACLAAGEVFRAVRLPTSRYAPTVALSFSAWDYTLGRGGIHEPGHPLEDLRVEFGLAGVGAVGCALIHALWACQPLSGRAIIADSDPNGIDDTNLNRCVLFATEHIGEPKASTAATICGTSQIDWNPVDKRYLRSTLPYVPDLLVSAVDTNRSRDQLQQGFWPPRVLAASTHDLRAEVLRCGPPGEGPCLRCFNPPETDVPDDVRREHLRSLSLHELEEFADEIERPASLVRRWAEQGGCGEIGDVALAHLRARDEPVRLFAVGFVSVLAGTLLAAELIKEATGRATALDDEHQIAKFQFMTPDAPGNGRASCELRDPTCPACSPGSHGAEIWQERSGRWNARSR